MTLERLFAWTAALAVIAAIVLVGPVPPAPPEPTIVVSLGVVAALPLAVVLLSWLYSLRGRTAGRVGARIRSLR